MSINTKHIEEVYIQFRRAQADYNNRGYRLPKNFESYFNSRFKEQNKKALIKITGWFLTKWNNIDSYEYFKCGFELYKKRFTYVKFFDKKIILLYKNRDKNKKREIGIVKKSLVESAIYVKKWMKKNNSDLYGYINCRNDNHRVVVDDYLKNRIDHSFFVYLLKKGMILSDTERSYIPYIMENYRNILFDLNNMKDFIKKLEAKI